jgi:uncharacterized protein involved in exopolysaccharide biosynthesis
VAVTVLGALISVAFAFTRPHAYMSQTVIMHREVIPQNLVQGGEAGAAVRGMGIRFREMVLASPLLEKVITKFDLFPDVESSRGKSSAIDELRQQVTFRTSGHGTFAIEYKGSTPELAQEVCGYLAELLIEWETQIQLESVSVTKNFLEEERARVEGELKAREKTLAEFLAEHPEFAEETANPAGGTSAGASIRAHRGGRQSTSTRDPRLRALQRQRDRIRARLETEPTPAPAARRASPEVERARRELSQAQRDLEDKQSRFTERHPDVVAAKRRVSQAERRLEEAERVAGVPVTAPASTPEERAALRQELQRLDREIAAQRRRARQGDRAAPKQEDTSNWVVQLETEWTRLNREVEDLRERYQGIEGKAYTAEIVAASELARQGDQLTIIEPASLPTRPAGAPRSLLVMAGTFVFGCLGLMLALGLALVDDRITSRWDVERLEIVPVLVEVPKAGGGKRGA